MKTEYNLFMAYLRANGYKFTRRYTKDRIIVSFEKGWRRFDKTNGKLVEGAIYQ